MRTLQFSIDGQKLTKNGDFSGIVRGTKGYLKCQFTFNGTDWARCKAVAVFEADKHKHAVAIEREGYCKIPDEVTDAKSFILKVIGVRDKDYRVITNRILISQED